MMNFLAKQLFKAPKPFEYIGRQMRLRGPGHLISAGCVTTTTARALGGPAEPMRIHCIPGYSPVLYLVEYVQRRELLLLDTGCPCDTARIQFFIEEVLSKESEAAGAGPLTMRDNLKLAVVTHCHADHAGGAGGYIAAGIPVARATKMEGSYVGLRRLCMLTELCIITTVGVLLGRQSENLFLYCKGLLGPYWSCPPPTSMLLADGDTLPLGFDDWSVVKIPGHTSHMISLYHRPSGVFYVADLTVKLTKGFFPPHPVHYPDAYETGLARLEGLDVRCVLLAHGGVVELAGAAGTRSWKDILDVLRKAFKGSHSGEVAGAGASKKDTSPKKKTSTKGNLGMELLFKGAIFVLNHVNEERRVMAPEELHYGPLPASSQPKYPISVEI